MSTTTQTNQLAHIEHFTPELKARIPQALSDMIDVSFSATNRATFYNSKQEQEAAVEKIHKELFNLDRGLYGLSLLLPGTNDYARQLGLGFLLDNPRGGKLAVLTEAQEAKLVTYLAQFMPPQRLFKLYRELRQNRVNNSRTRKLILRTILGSRRLELWAVKYRFKIRQALSHAWGRATALAMKAILSKEGKDRSEQETKGLERNITKYAAEPTKALECVKFIFGVETGLTIPILKSYHAARTDLSKGKDLPEEQLEYLRNRLHPTVSRAEVLKLAKSTMSEGKKMAVQRQAKEAGVEIKFDPSAADPVRLYIYAYEMGMTNEISNELKKKAKKTADMLLTKYDKIGIVIDNSLSMRGHGTQKNRPIAVALATRDMLEAASENATIEYCGQETNKLVQPIGDTSLSYALVKVLKSGKLDSVFVITDGYENAPAGRFAQTVEAVRKIGIVTPIFQIAPVMAAEKGGIRQISSQVPAMPLNKPEAINVVIIKSLLVSDVDKAILGMAKSLLPQLGENSDD